MLLWVAQLLSQLASNMVLAALMATVVSATGSNTANAVLILTFLVPAVIFSTVAGVFVERSDARLIMLGSNLLRAGGTVLFIFVGTQRRPDPGDQLLHRHRDRVLRARRS